jgi:hypothetical protein
MMNRVGPSAPPGLIFTSLELQLLDRMHKDGADPPAESLSAYIIRRRLSGSGS